MRGTAVMRRRRQEELVEPLALLFALDGDKKTGEALGLLPDVTGVEDRRPRRKSGGDDPDAWIALRTAKSEEAVELDRPAWAEEGESAREEAA